MITSAHNPKLKLIRRLLESRRQREKEGLFVCEGEDLVLAADDAGVEPVELLVSGEDVEPELVAALSTLAHPPRVLGIYRRDAPAARDPAADARALARRRSGKRRHAAAHRRCVRRRRRALGRAAPIRPGRRRCARPRAPIFRVPLARFDDAPRPWIALVAHAGTPLPELELGESATFVLGAEREGLPADVLERCDVGGTIPLAPESESLNVAAAGAIALYEARRR